MDLIRQLPYSLEAEQSVLGSVIIDPACFNEVLVKVKSKHFYVPAHVNIYDAMVEMSIANDPLDAVTLIEKLKSKGVFEEVGGKEYILKLAQTVPSSANVMRYAQIIREKCILRDLIEASSKITDMCYEGADSSNAILDRAEQLIYDVADSKSTQGFTPISQAVSDTIERINNLSGKDRDQYVGLPTYYKDLDNMLVGLNNTDLVLLAARPGMGKTSFALNIAYNVAHNTDKAVVIFSLEMSTQQLAERMLSSEAMVDSKKLRSGELSDNEWERLAIAAGALAKTKIYFDDTPGVTVAEMKAKCRRLKNIGLVVIDYLQLMDSGTKNDNRVQVVSEISRGLKLMAKDLKVPVLTLSQLSRGPESRQDKRPMLSDLRESGSIEQDADIVMFLYRDDYYNKNTESRNVCECNIQKNRHGSTGKVDFAWIGEYTRFTSLERVHDEP